MSLSFAREPKSQTRTPVVDTIADAHDTVEKLLDIAAVEERTALLCVEPHNNVAWRIGQTGLKVELTSGITFSAESGEFKVTVTDAQGNVKPDPPYAPPPFHTSYRYFRYSQAAQNIFESYRNMFLALESLLDYVERPLLPGFV